MRSVRNRGWLVVGFSLAMLFALPAPKAGAESLRPVVIDVRSHYTEPPPAFDGLSCLGIAGVAPECDLWFSGVSQFSGTFRGEEYFELHGHMTPERKLTYEGFGTIADGEVEGCGRGGFRFEIYDGWIDYSQYDPVTGTAPGYNKWRIDTDGSTGGLRRRIVGGEGETYWTAQFNTYGYVEGHFGEGDFTGKLTCLVDARDSTGAQAAEARRHLLPRTE